jgi:hypothetical protein
VETARHRGGREGEGAGGLTARHAMSRVRWVKAEKWPAVVAEPDTRPNDVTLY